MDSSGILSKPRQNLTKHKVDFADAAVSLEDPRAVTISDPDAIDEERFVTLAADPTGRVLVTCIPTPGPIVASYPRARPAQVSANDTRQPNAQRIRLFQR